MSATSKYYPPVQTCIDRKLLTPSIIEFIPRRKMEWRLLFTLLLLFLVPGILGSSTGHRRFGKSSVFSLFSLKEKSRFWSESVIRSGEFDDLSASKPSKLAAQNFSRASNIASYLKLQEVDSIYLPVPVNFIFIGFEGKGNYEFKLQAEELERWFTNIDHVFEHTRIPQIGERLSSFYKMNIDKQSQYFPVVSHVNFNFSVHAIEMSEKVTNVFERAIEVLARKEDVMGASMGGNVTWQVDLDAMDDLVSSLIQYLQLDNAYNVFVLNPKRVSKRARYGYRRGLSESELQFLRENKDLQTRILQSGSHPESVLAIDNIRRPLYQKHPMVKFAWTITEETDTVEWSSACLGALSSIEKLNNEKDTADVIYNKVQQLLGGKYEDWKILLKKELKTGDFSGLHADCLTDTWIGKDRWAFIDLSSGPFSWGPAVGGEGVRTEQSLPNVERTIGAVAEISEEEAENRLQDVIQEKFSVFAEGSHQSIDILLAEIDIYELFAFKHCKGRKAKLALCEELDERMRELKNELNYFEGEEYDESHKVKASEALKRMENWNLFSDTSEDFHNYTVARDTFLAHLGATLWGSMRHIVAPSIADGAYHSYEKVSFQLFFITQEKVRNAKLLPVDVDALKNGLSSLLLPSQKATFSQHTLSLSEDPALAMAFSVARRAAAVSMLLVNGTYRRTVRTYLDSAILQHQLQRLNDHGSLKGKHANSRTVLEIPVFWFIHGDPLLVDKHYQAKSLSNMIIVAQSEDSSWESHLQCNGQSVLLDLRRPIKAAIASAAEHIAGLVPLHLVYSHAHETAIEDWIWSVGCNPFAATSQGWHISQFQLDTIARSYIITTLEESIQLVNSGVHRLVMERSSILSQERDLVSKYNFVVGLWRRISTISGELRYHDALRLLLSLEDASRGFVDQVNSTLALLHPLHCTGERKVQVVFDITTIPAFLAVVVILLAVLRPRRTKPKIN
ncbi:hypothetical protein V2J09_011276 [Rumex salicifolius]